MYPSATRCFPDQRIFLIKTTRFCGSRNAQITLCERRVIFLFFRQSRTRFLSLTAFFCASKFCANLMLRQRLCILGNLRYCTSGIRSRIFYLVSNYYSVLYLSHGWLVLREAFSIIIQYMTSVFALPQKWYLGQVTDICPVLDFKCIENGLGHGCLVQSVFILRMVSQWL